MLSWEYPPLGVGGIATHVEGLATALVRTGHEVVVLSVGQSDVAADTTMQGVRVLRADTALPWLPDHNLVARQASANHQLTQCAALLGNWRPDVIHAHDWVVAWAADTLKALFGVPMIATLHGTERGRHGGHVPMGVPGEVNSVEWWLTYQAREVIACSRFMVREVIDGFDLPPDKVHLVPNGVEAGRWRTAPWPEGAEREPLVVAWGRIQYEKGFQVLASAVGALRHRVPGVRCVIAGRGTYLPELQTHLDMEGVGDLVHLAGFVSDDELRDLLRRAACVVIPSLYEPFGIVALEGMAAGAPMVVARTGGLAEIVDGSGAGLLFDPGNPHDLADRVADVLQQPHLADELRHNAEALLQRTYTWDAIAEATVSVYHRAGN